jgi:hypothetical protein
MAAEKGLDNSSRNPGQIIPGSIGSLKMAENSSRRLHRIKVKAKNVLVDKIAKIDEPCFNLKGLGTQRKNS